MSSKFALLLIFLPREEFGFYYAISARLILLLTFLILAFSFGVSSNLTYFSSACEPDAALAITVPRRIPAPAKIML
jgi:hypothetical protein